MGIENGVVSVEGKLERTSLEQGALVGGKEKVGMIARLDNRTGRGPTASRGIEVGFLVRPATALAMSNGNGIVPLLQGNGRGLGATALGLIQQLFVTLVPVGLELTVLVEVDPYRSAIIITPYFPSVGARDLGVENPVEEAQVVVVPGNSNPRVAVVVVVVEIKPAVTRTIG